MSALDATTRPEATSQIRFDTVRVARPAPIGESALGLTSAIAKTAVEGTELHLGPINLAGDDQADRTVHGGPDKAVYAHPAEHLAAWATDLEEPELTSTGSAPFGENLSTFGATETTAHIGDLWHWGDAVLEICQPRWPCQKLTVHRASARVGPLMRSSGRTGWYLRVLRPGTVPTSGTIDVEPHSAGVTVFDAHRAMLDRRLDDRDLVERVAGLGGTLAAEWRMPLLERLADAVA
ncbi:MAG: MOSC domain-containing protein [Actinomycetota bacterium]